jgi:hypothetical protein
MVKTSRGGGTELLSGAIHDLPLVNFQMRIFIPPVTKP